MLQLLVPFIAFAAVVACLYVLWRPHWAFLLVILMFPGEQLLQAYIPLFVAKQSLANMAVFAIALVALTLRSFRREQLSVGFGNPVTVSILLLYLLWTLGLFYSPVPDILDRSWTSFYAYQALFLLVLPLLIVDVHQYRRMLIGLMIVGAAISALIILNPRSTYHSGRLVLDLGMIGGGVRDAGNPLATASLGALTALVAALYRPERGTTWMTVLRVTAFVLGMGVAIGSGSRGQVLAAALTGIVFYPISRRLANPKQFLLTSTGLLVLMIGIYIVFKIFIGAQNQERWNPVGMLRDTTLRLDMVWVLFSHYLDNPTQWLFGLGTNAFEAISPDRNADYVHNIMAEVLCEHGIVGAGLFGLAAFFLFKYGRRLWAMYSEDPSMRATVAILMATCVYSLLEALKQGSMSLGGPFPWWLVLAKLYTFERRVDEHAMEQWSLAADEQTPELEHGLPDGGEDMGDQQRGYALGY